MTTTARLNALSEQIETRRAERAKAEATKEAAVEAYNRLLTELKATYKVNTLDEAEALLKKMDKKLDKQISKAEAILYDEGS